MEKYLSDAFKQLDKQAEERRIQLAYISLNNMYLSVERGDTKLTRTIANELYNLLVTVYPYCTEPVMNNYWNAELEKLPNWFEF